uniref:ABC transporter ATP-binding protein n=1 Tax=Fundidesulfovibrio putealis TaxID=270496 RepID=A0A7C4EM85_9BACT
MSERFVELSGVDLAYSEDSDSLAVQGLDLTIHQGEFAAVVGPSGCGKSTLLKLVTGLRPPTRGAVVVDGREVSGPLSFVGMAFQNPTLLPWRRLLDNVMLPLEIVEPHRARLRAERGRYEEMARELLRTVGLGRHESKYPWQLSGGMQQRASLCRALIHQPRLLMLDEPFGALDAFTREELWCVLRDIWEAKRFTVVLVTHDLRESVFLADTVHVMSRRPGRVVHSRAVDLPRPRSLESCYSPDFVDIVHELRGHIEAVRRGPAAEDAPDGPDEEEAA